MAYPMRGMMILLAPVAKIFGLMTGLLMPSSRGSRDSTFRSLNEEETRVALHAGARGLSALRRRIGSGALDIGSWPVKEVMVPRPEIRAIEIDSRREDVLETVRSAGYSRYPVYRGRLDSIEGIIHGKDIIAYLIDNKEFAVKDLLRKAFFVPEFAPLEKVLLQMQEKAVHMALVVDEFGNLDGLVTLEDTIEEIVGVIDVAAKRVIGQLIGANVSYVHSRFALQVDFRDGKVQRVGDQQGVGRRGHLQQEKTQPR